MTVYVCKLGRCKELRTVRETEKMIIANDGIIQRHIRKSELPKVSKFIGEVITYSCNREEAIKLYVQEMKKVINEQEDLLAIMNHHLDKIRETKF